MLLPPARRRDPEELVVRLEGEYVRVREREVAALVDEVRGELGLTTQARERFRMSVLRRFYEDYGARLGGLAWRDFGEVERALKAKGFLNRWLERVWPVVASGGARPGPAHAACRALRLPRRAILDEAGATPPPPFAYRLRLERGRRRPRRRGTRAPRRAAAHLRPRDRRRGAGSDAHAASRRRAARERRLDHLARRRRAGNRARRPPALGRRAGRAARRRRGGGRGAPPRLPRARRDHVPRAPAARSHRPGRRAAPRVSRRAGRRRASSASTRQTSSSGRFVSLSTWRARTASSP